MDPHTVNSMGTQGGMSIPMSIAMAGANASNQQAMAMGMNGSMGMNAYGIPQQPQQQHQLLMNMGQMDHMTMGSMAMNMNPTAATTAGSAGMQVAGAQGSASSADWRIQLTREHRANLIAKIYNEMVRVSADPVPGIKLWMNVSWYERTLYKESHTQEEYINKIFTRLKSLRAQQTDMNAVMAAQTLPNQGMLSRLDFSYYSTLNLNQHAGVPTSNGGPTGSYLPNPQYGGPVTYPGVQHSQPNKPMVTGAGGMPANPVVPTTTTPRMTAKSDGGTLGNSGDMTAEYWRQHAALKAKYHDDVEKVHSAFKKYVDHMKGHDETEQKKKLRYLLSYVQLCASILNEDKTTNPPRKIEELDKVYKYIVKIVNPYLKKLRTETDKRSFTLSASGHDPTGVNVSAPTNPAVSVGIPASTEGTTTSGHTTNMPNGAMLLQQGHQNMSLKQKQQHYLMQQRHQQMQQQQRMQAQARQQQMMQHQHLLQQQQKDPSPRNQAQYSAQQNNQSNAPSQLQSSQPSGNQQSSQQKQQHLPQQAQTQQAQRAQQNPNPQHQPSQSHPPASQQSQQARQPNQLPQQSQLHQQRTSGQQQSQQQGHRQGQQQTQQQPQQQGHRQGQQQAQQQSQHQAQQQAQQQEVPPHLHSLQKSQQQQQQATQSAQISRADSSSLNLDESLYGGMDSSGLLQMPSSLGSSGPTSGFMNFPNDLSPTNFSSMDLLDMDGFMGQDSNSSSGGGQTNTHNSGGNNTSSGDGADSDLMFMEAL